MSWLTSDVAGRAVSLQWGEKPQSTHVWLQTRLQTRHKDTRAGRAGLHLTVVCAGADERALMVRSESGGLSELLFLIRTCC